MIDKHMLCRIIRDGYNAKLVRRGEILIELDFLNNMGEELKMMNRGKKGRSYKYGDSLFVFLGYLYAFIRNYRILEGICRVSSNMVISDSTGFKMGRATEYIEYRYKLIRRKKSLRGI